MNHTCRIRCPRCRYTFALKAAEAAEEAAEFLRQLLATRPRASSEVFSVGIDNGWNKRTLYAGARLAAVIKYPLPHPEGRRGSGGWWWRLPANEGGHP